MSEIEKSSGSVLSSGSEESSSAPSSSGISSSGRPSSGFSSGKSSVYSSGGSSGSDVSDGEESSSGGGTGGECPGIYSITVTLYRVGDHEPPEALCFAADELTGCAAVVSFVIDPFDEICYNHLIARVSLAGSSRTVAIYNVGGVYQVEWGFSGGADLDLFPDQVYTVQVCLERTVGTPVECTVPAGCCATVEWTSPEVCCCNEFEDGVQCGDLPCCCPLGWAPVGPDCECQYVGT